MPPMIVGLCGYAGAGKDAAADYLITDGWARFSPSDQIRAFLYEQNPDVAVLGDYGNRRLRTLVDAYGWDGARKAFPTLRVLQQGTGDAARAVFGRSCLIDASLASLPTGVGDAVCTSIRFPYEADAIRDRGGVMVRVTRPGVGPVNAHPSETAMDGYVCDAELVNDDTLAVLGDRIRFAVTAISQFSRRHKAPV